MRNLQGIFIFEYNAGFDSDDVIDAIHDGGFGVFADDLTYDDYWGRLMNGNFEVDIPVKDVDAFRKIMDQFPHRFIKAN